MAIHYTVFAMVISVAFIDGALRIVNIPTFYLWKDYYKLSPGMNCLLRYITKIPWCIKPVFASLSDNYYIFGYRTKIYFLLTGALQAICLLLLKTPIPSLLLSTILLCIEQVSIAFRDTLAEGLMVVLSKQSDQNLDNSKESSSQKYVSAIYTLRFIGNLASNYVSGLLLNYFTPHQVIGFCAVLPIISFLQALLFFKENRVNVNEEGIEKKQLTPSEIGEFLERNSLKGYLLYVIIMLLWPNTINGIRYFLIDQLGFSTTDIGKLFTLSSLFYVLFMFILNTWYKNYSYQNFYSMICKMMILNIVVRVLMMINKFKKSAFSLALVDQSINNLFYDLPSIPLLSIICKAAPKSREATFYAVFVSIVNFCCSLANLTGYLFLDLMNISAKNYMNVNIVNYQCALWAFMLLRLIPNISFPDRNKQIKEKNSDKDVPFREEKVLSSDSSQEDN